MHRLDGRVAVVTGSSRGIGRAIAESLAQVGARVAITGRSLELPQEVAQAINRREGDDRAAAFVVDVTRADGVASFARAVLDRFGRVDILVNNAGISPMYTRALKIQESDFDAVVATNLKGTFLCCQAFGKHFVEQKSGVVVNISSIAARVGSPRLAAYAATKGAVDALTRSLAIEWAECNVRVCGVAPAFIETDMNAGLREIPALAQEALDKTPMRRFGQPNDVAGAVVFLCSDAARYITGSLITIDGGWLAQ